MCVCVSECVCVCVCVYMKCLAISAPNTLSLCVKPNFCTIYCMYNVRAEQEQAQS